MTQQILYLKNSEIQDLVNMSEIISICEEVFKGIVEGTAKQENELMWLRPNHDPERDPFTDFLEVQPAYSKPLEVCGVKTVMYFLENVNKGLPILSAMFYLTHPETGVPLAVTEGESIVGLRTGANSAVGAKYLAKKDSSSLAIIGCGLQARTHLQAMKEIFNIEDVRVYDINRETMNRFIDEATEKYNVSVRPCDSPKDAVQGADITCMLTTAAKPVVFDEWLEPGCFVSAVHSFSDLDIKFSETADKYVIAEPKTDIGISKLRFKGYSEKKVYGLIGEIILGKKAGRENNKERILFHHMGIVGLAELAVASLAYKRARERRVGVELDRSSVTL